MGAEVEATVLASWADTMVGVVGMAGMAEVGKARVTAYLEAGLVRYRGAKVEQTGKAEGVEAGVERNRGGKVEETGGLPARAAKAAPGAAARAVARTAAGDPV